MGVRAWEGKASSARGCDQRNGRDMGVPSGLGEVRSRTTHQQRGQALPEGHAQGPIQEKTCICRNALQGPLVADQVRYGTHRQMRIPAPAAIARAKSALQSRLPGGGKG